MEPKTVTAAKKILNELYKQNLLSSSYSKELEKEAQKLIVDILEEEFSK